MITEQLEPAVEETEMVEKPPERAQRSRVRLAALVATALVMCAGLFAWWHTANDGTLALAETRSAVLVAANQHIETLNSLDYRKVEPGLKSWSAATTGTLHDQLGNIGAEDRTLLADQKKISAGTVVDSAVIALDGTSATVLASVEITVKDAAKPDAEPTLKRNRFSADLLKVGGEWKLESLQQVAVNLS